MNIAAGILVCLSCTLQENTPAITADIPFVQETHESYTLQAKAEEVYGMTAIAVDGKGQVWVATEIGVFTLINNVLEPVKTSEDQGPAFDIAAASDGSVWVGAWDGLYHGYNNSLEKVHEVEGPIAAVAIYEDRVAAAGPNGLWRCENGPWRKHDLPCARSIRALLWDTDGSLWIATGMGLTHHTPNGNRLFQLNSDILSSDVRTIAWAKDGSLWAGGLGGVTVYQNNQRKAHYTPEQGLPSVYVQAAACGPDGRMWIGTDLGITRWDGQSWSLRHSHRWLCSDKVHDVAFGPDGTAWVATALGVSAIRPKNITLAEKAEFFLDLCWKRHVRPPGLVEHCRLKKLGDLFSWEPDDDDNDGGYTAMYLAMESFRYAATKDPDAQENAQEIFDALCLLQTITETPGFIARTVVPSDWKNMHDPNKIYTPQERAAALVETPRFKPVEERWRLSSDKKWLWKGDTSSDEITAHFYGWAWYYDLAANESEKIRVRKLTQQLMDYIIDHGYVLEDIDGEHTCWGVWAPERLNHDPDWRAERGVNSVEILSYLKTTYHMTGDERYQSEYLNLLNNHGYAENVRNAKAYETAWRTHIDDELLAFAYPALLRYEDNPERKALFQESLDHWYQGVCNEQNPLFNFTYALLSQKDAHLHDAMFTLRDIPLDLIHWRVDNTRREDIDTVRKPLIEPLQTSRMLPPSERGVIRWDKNLWAAIQGDGGQSEGAPTFWLTPYWMGRWAGYIAAP